MRFRVRLVAVLLLGAACSPQEEAAPAVTRYPFLVQFDHQPGRSDSLSAVAAGGDSITIIPLASAMVLKAPDSGGLLQAVTGVDYVLPLIRMTQSGPVTVNFATPATPADVALLRSLPIDASALAFNADSTSVVVYISYRALNLFAGDANVVATAIQPLYRPDDFARSR